MEKLVFQNENGGTKIQRPDIKITKKYMKSQYFPGYPRICSKHFTKVTCAEGHRDPTKNKISRSVQFSSSQKPSVSLAYSRVPGYSFAYHDAISN